MLQRTCLLLVTVWFLFPVSPALAEPAPAPQTQQTTTASGTSPLDVFYTLIGVVLLDTVLSYGLLVTDVVMLFFPKNPPLLDGVLGGVGSLLFGFNVVVLSFTFANRTYTVEPFFVALMAVSVAGLGLSGYLLYRAFRPRPGKVRAHSNPPLPTNSNRLVQVRF